MSGLVSTGMDDYLRTGKQPQLVSWSLTSLFSTNMAISETKTTSVCSHPGQLSLLTSVEGEISTGHKCGNTLQLGSKGRHGSFQLWMYVWVAAV